MSFIALASRRVVAGTVQRSSTAAAAIGGTRQMSVADKDNILPVSYSTYIYYLLGDSLEELQYYMSILVDVISLLQVIEIITSVQLMCVSLTLSFSTPS